MTARDRKPDLPAVAGGALGVEYVGEIDAAGYQEHLQTPEVQTLIARARASWRRPQGDGLASDLPS
jgi:protein involved in polysaccharide export with SLBB domain